MTDKPDRLTWSKWGMVGPGHSQQQSYVRSGDYDALHAERDALKAALQELVAEAMHFAIMDRAVAKARALLAAPEDAP